YFMEDLFPGEVDPPGTIVEAILGLSVSVIQELINIGRFRPRGLGVELLEPRGIADMIPGRAMATQRAGRINDERLSEAMLQLSHNFATSRPPAKPTCGRLDDPLDIRLREATVVE